jgi:hypothetical protein
MYHSRRWVLARFWRVEGLVLECLRLDFDTPILRQMIVACQFGSILVQVCVPNKIDDNLSRLGGACLDFGGA